MNLVIKTLEQIFEKLNDKETYIIINKYLFMLVKTKVLF